jgi:hypothetical protein
MKTLLKQFLALSLIAVTYIPLTTSQPVPPPLSPEATTAPLTSETEEASLTTPIDKLIEFIDMEKGHMGRWFNFARKHHSDKFNLLERHHDERADLHVKELRKAKTGGFSASMLRSKLNDLVNLHKEQVAEWGKLFKNYYEKGREIHETNRKEFEKFRASLR